MKIIIDVREHSLIEKLKTIAAESGSTTIQIETAALLLGDILVKLDDDTTEILLFERKSFTDLLASIKDGRYEEQSHRIIHTSGMQLHNVVYVLEGIFSTLRSPMDKKVILSAMTSLSYFKGFSVFRTATVFETAELIWAMTAKIQKEFEKGKSAPSYRVGGLLKPSADSGPNETSEPLEQNVREDVTTLTQPPPQDYSNFVKKSKRENITPENIGEILLSQIPGISSHSAIEILKHFGGSFSQLITEIKTNPEKLNAVYLESSEGKRRKLSGTVIQSILKYLIGNTTALSAGEIGGR